MIIGEGIIPEAEAVRDVQTALHDRQDVVLLAHIADIAGQAIPDGSTIYNLEPLFDGCRSLKLGYLEVLRKHKVWDYQARNVGFLNAHGIDAMHVPYRYTPELERVRPAEKDVDVLFFGSISPRRAEILGKIKGLVIAHGCYGRDLDALVARAKIVVNVHYTDRPHPLEVVRLNYLMANGCFVISERGWDDSENALYAPGIIFTDDISRACAHWLRYDRTAIERAAVRTMRSMPMEILA